MVVPAGVLARGVLYFCKVAVGAAVCDEQSDWHLLRERTGKAVHLRARASWCSDPALRAPALQV